MAHFAELDADNNVLRVIVVHDNDAPDEKAGKKFLADIYGTDTRWIQTSYSGQIRKSFAGIGYKYDAGSDSFRQPKPFPSWSFDTEKHQWKPPKDEPKSGPARWDETSQKWELI